MFHHFLPVYALKRDSLIIGRYQNYPIPSKYIQVRHLALMPDCSLAWVQPNMAMTVGIWVCMILLMSQSSISVSIQKQLEHPTVVKAIYDQPQLRYWYNPNRRPTLRKDSSSVI